MPTFVLLRHLANVVCHGHNLPLIELLLTALPYVRW